VAVLERADALHRHASNVEIIAGLCLALSTFAREPFMVGIGDDERIWVTTSDARSPPDSKATATRLPIVEACTALRTTFQSASCTRSGSTAATTGAAGRTTSTWTSLACPRPARAPTLRCARS
jgi:hypothetical protein